MSQPLYIAVDLGAGSGRVFIAVLRDSEFLLEQVRRFHYPPIEVAEHLRWDLPTIFEEIKHGLCGAALRARELDGEIRSIGVDSWGVDYGLIDQEGNVCELPICYRDRRTDGVMDEVFACLPREEIFERTGIQFMPFNTLFQLFAHVRDGVPPKATSLLLIPDLINFLLTGRRVEEYTNATTTQMLNAQTMEWDQELLKILKLPAEMLSPIAAPGEYVGQLRAELASELGFDTVRVVAPATHDTGSAVAGAPLRDRWAYISSGTWSLVGVERNEVLINEEVARHNFTNEGGAFGTIRFLKNVMGLWILESCRKEWKEGGVSVDYDVLLQDVAAIPELQGLIFPDDQRFLHPPSMIAAIAMQLNETGQRMPSEPATIAKVILDSLAFRYASVLCTISSLTKQKIAGVQIIGGGSQNPYLNQATANASGLPVCAGPVEATVIGNVLVQSIADGRFASLTEARRYIAKNIQTRTFVPSASTVHADTMLRYAAIEARYM